MVLRNRPSAFKAHKAGTAVKKRSRPRALCQLLRLVSRILPDISSAVQQLVCDAEGDAAPSARHVSWRKHSLARALGNDGCAALCQRPAH